MTMILIQLCCNLIAPIRVSQKKKDYDFDPEFGSVIDKKKCRWGHTNSIKKFQTPKTSNRNFKNLTTKTK